MKTLPIRVILFCVVLGFGAGLALSNARTDDPLGVAVSPQNLLLGATQSGAVTVHTAIPLSAVARSTVALNGIPAAVTYADSLGHLVAKFKESDVKAIVEPPAAILTLTGDYRAGGTFSGSDTVTVTVFDEE